MANKKTTLFIKRTMPLFILITSVFMGIGYASLTSVSLNIIGGLSGKIPDGVHIQNVEYVKKNETDITTSTIDSFFTSSLSMTIHLDADSNDYEIYRITVKNKTNERYRYVGINYDEIFFKIKNDNIEFFEITQGEESISQGTILEPNQEKTFLIKFKYVDNYIPSEENTLSNIINFKFSPINSKIVFNSMGGNIDTSSYEGLITHEDEVYKIKAAGEEYGELPVPTKAGHTFLGWMKELIPNYYEVDYIENSTGKSIEIDVPGNNSDLSFEIKYVWSKLPPTGSYANLFTSYQSEKHITTRIIQYGSNMTFYNINSKAENSSSMSYERKINEMYIDKLISNGDETFTYISNENSATSPRISGTTQSQNIIVMNNYNSAQYKLYNFKIYDKDIIIRNILPCISKENIIGICDLVNEKFYFNANQSDFKYGTLKSYVNSNNIIDKERTLYANWQANEYKITYDCDGGNLNFETSTIKYGEKYGELPTPSKIGYTFAGWYDGERYIDSEDTFTYTKDITLTAKWEIEVTFDANGGEIQESYRKYILNDTYGELPTPSREGYEFIGWSKNNYSEVEYIERDGYGALKTDILGNNNNLSFEVQYEWTKLPKEGEYINVFASYESETHVSSRIIQYGPNITYFNINSKAGESQKLTLNRIINTKYTDRLISNDDNTFTYKTNNQPEVISTRVTATDSVKNINVLTGGYIKLYYFKIYENGELIRDYIPAVSEFGEYGLYEKINTNFISNFTTGYYKGGKVINIINSQNISNSDLVTGSHTLYANWKKIE